MDVNIAFSRQHLAVVHKDVRKAFPDIKNPMKAAWVHHSRSLRDTWEFHGPEDFYYCMSASNAYDARAKGWDAYLKHKGVESVD